MTERERWIVYPLLFLALGAALRDKIIKTTESQRIKCQGLCVFDSNDQPLLILGPEQFPELRPNAPNLIRVDEVIADRVVSDSVTGNKLEGGRFLTRRDDVGVLDAEVVIAKNFVLTDGQNNLRLDGRYTVPLMRLISGFINRQAPAQPTPPSQVSDDSTDDASVQSQDEATTEGDESTPAEAPPSEAENQADVPGDPPNDEGPPAEAEPNVR